MDLVELKRKHRQVFCLDFVGTRVIFRLPTWREHDIYERALALSWDLPGQIEDRIFREICLDPALIDEMNQTPAGLVSTVIRVALLLSGNNLSSPEKMDRLNADLQTVRESVSTNAYESLIILICKAFPSFKPSEVEDLSYWEILRLSIMAEQILEMKEPVKFFIEKKQRSITDKLFDDARQAEKEESMPGQPSNRPQQPMTREQLRQAEMIRRIKERNSS